MLATYLKDAQVLMKVAGTTDAVSRSESNGLMALAQSGQGFLASDDRPARVESPPWDMADDCLAPSPIDHKMASGAGGEGDGSPPPSSQLRTTGSAIAVPVASGADTQPVEAVGRKSTPSTISDSVSERDEVIPGGASERDEGASKRDDRQGGKAKKRAMAKGGDSEELDALEESQDTKRRPRKSARLA